MGDFPRYNMPAPPILTPWSPDSLGLTSSPAATAMGTLFSLASVAWPTNNLALFYPFNLYDWATAYQLLFWVGATSSGNIDVGIYDSQKNLIVSAGSTAMSATVDTVQELNITDTVLGPGSYLLAVTCSTTGGTTYYNTINDEIVLSAITIYQQASALPLPDPCAPVISTSATPPLIACGIQFRSVF